MAITYNEDGSSTKTVVERQEAKKSKSNGKSKGNSKKGYRR